MKAQQTPNKDPYWAAYNDAVVAANYAALQCPPGTSEEVKRQIRESVLTVKFREIGQRISEEYGDELPF